jgi:cbb3-type cytochrome oxidase maturation protein
MNIVLVMVGLSIVLLLGAAACFFWAVDHGQFDDVEASGLLALEDHPQRESSESDFRIKKPT